jgi:hypothetical protein
MGTASRATESRKEAVTHEQRLREQFRAATLLTMTDEQLSGMEGPVGVKLRYQIKFPLGVSKSARDAVFVNLTAETPSKNGLEFLSVRKEATPFVSGATPPGTYMFTEDFVPAFMPLSYSKSPVDTPSSVVVASDHCFRWTFPMTSQDIRASTPQKLSIEVFLGRVADTPIKRKTNANYRLGDFYASAMNTGVVDCAT